MPRLPRTRDNQVRQVPLRWIEDADHYDVIVDAISRAGVSLWIATANLKELMVEDHRAAPGRRRNSHVGQSVGEHGS